MKVPRPVMRIARSDRLNEMHVWGRTLLAAVCRTRHLASAR